MARERMGEPWGLGASESEGRGSGAAEEAALGKNVHTDKPPQRGRAAGPAPIPTRGAQPLWSSMSSQFHKIPSPAKKVAEPLHESKS